MLEKLVRLVMEDVQSSMAAAGGTSAPYKTSVSVHKGSVLSPLLFNLLTEEATMDCRREVP